jgi:hypothetical protein
MNVMDKPIEVVAARAEADYVVTLAFSDGRTGWVDLHRYLWGAAFDRVQDPDYFRRLRIRYGTVTWPDGTDIAPEVLYRDLVESPSSAYGLA